MESRSAPPGPSTPPQAGDDLLTVLADVERQLTALRAYRQQQEEAQRQFREAEEALRRQQEALRADQADLHAERERLRQAAEELSRRHEEIAHQAQTLARERDAIAAAARQREADLARREQHLREQEAALTERAGTLETLQARLQEQSREAAEARAEAERFRQELARAGEAQSELIATLTTHQERLEQAQVRIQTLTADLAHRESQIHELQTQLATATSRLRQVSDALREQSDLVAHAQALEAALKQRDASITQLRTELDDARRAPGGAVPPDVIEALETRRRRLRLMRDILRRHVQQLRQAHEVLQARYEEFERQTSHAANIPAAAPPRAAARSPNGAWRQIAAGTCALVLATAGLGAISWAAASHLAPARWAARAVLVAASDPGSPAPAPDQLAAWQHYHQTLLHDAPLVELAAERMARRGIVSLSTPGVLRQRLARDLTAEFPQPGTIVLELRGVGRTPTVRVLDTFVSALASEANAHRDQRVDGLGTALAQPVDTGSEPIEDPRPLWAAGIFAGLCLVTFGGGAVVWRRLAQARERYVHDEPTDVYFRHAA